MKRINFSKLNLSHFVRLLIMIVVAAGVMNKGFAGSLTPNRTPLAKSIAAIKMRFNQPYSLYAGYPMCEDVFKRKTDENNTLLAELIPPALRPYYNEMDHAFPSIAAKDESLQHADYPRHPIVHPRFRRTRGGFSCFAGETLIPTLQQSSIASEASYSIVSKEIYFINNGEYVLSSTVQYMSDPRYVTDCWDQVVLVTAGEVCDGEKYETISFRSENSRETITVVATPDHRFYVDSYLSDGWAWEKAQDLSVHGYRLMAGSKASANHQLCDVVSKEEDTAVDNPFGAFWLPDDTTFNVFNLGTALTDTFYVGTETTKALVHNAY